MAQRHACVKRQDRCLQQSTSVNLHINFRFLPCNYSYHFLLYNKPIKLTFSNTQKTLQNTKSQLIWFIYEILFVCARLLIIFSMTLRQTLFRGILHHILVKKLQTQMQYQQSNIKRFKLYIYIFIHSRRKYLFIYTMHHNLYNFYSKYLLFLNLGIRYFLPATS